MIPALLIICLFLGIFLLLIYVFLRRRFILPIGEVLYSDTGRSPGVTLRSTSLPLVGKPDYILKKDSHIIPVEIKRGKTPSSPYHNHIAQLYAYCLLIEENYGSRPPYGIIEYPDKEFILEFPEGVEDRLKEAVTEMLTKKKHGPKRGNLRHICRDCRAHN
jgi:CRISPR-associated exonuclease Cas4